MIVNKSNKGFHIINHAAHGLLAGKIATFISKDLMPKHWFETIIAITEHDDRQLDFEEKNYLSELGIPLDFTENSATVSQILKRLTSVINSVNRKSSWVRLLVSYHLDFLYSDLRKNSKKIKAFLNKETKTRAKILDMYKIDDKEGRSYYEVLRFCDRLSLILCKNEVPTGGRKLEINNSINGDTYYIRQSKKGEFIIQPWIFDQDKFQCSIEEKIIEVANFKSSKIFETKLCNTYPQLIWWSISKE